MRKVAISSYLGNTLEYYDYLLYGSAAALVFAPLFFSSLDPITATIASFGTLAAGAVARPLGGILFGYMGDRYGRKSGLMATMLLMGIASGSIGLLPTYDQIGVWAPMLLVLLRLLQGLAVGGEWGGATLMAGGTCASGEARLRDLHLPDGARDRRAAGRAGDGGRHHLA